MLKKYKVIIIKGNKFTTYRMCSTKEEAQGVMSKLNARMVSKAYKRAIKKGKRGISHAARSWAYSRTAIQY